jgi:biofilm PGA synthesis N-glycosyltransferase PgaC
MAVKNEGVRLAAKLENLARLEYPGDRVEFIVVSDASTDATNEVLTRMQPGIRSVLLPEPEGKASALNHAIAIAEGEIVVFVDARQKIEPEALKFLVGNFADASVGCVSGELVLVDDSAAAKARAVGLYWRMEKQIRKLESETGSVVGATGALYAVRRKLITPLPVGTLCDDVYIPFQVVRQGYRVVFEPRAVALDVVFSDWRREFQRKVRTLTGNYQLLQLAPWLVTSANPLRFEFFSHKLLRLFVPFALLLALSSSLLADGWLYRAGFVVQLCFYGLGFLTFTMPQRRVPRLAAVSFTFVMLNAAAVLGLIKFVTGKKDVWMTPSLKPGQAQ